MADGDTGRRSPRLSEAPPPTGVPIEEHPGVFRVVAANPGVMTYHGTNSWFVETEGPGGPLVLIDPGPDDDAHLAALIAAGRGRISHILVSHAHGDHSGLARRLANALDLPVSAHRALAQHGLSPDVAIDEGFSAGRLGTLHTPGHAAGHLCFTYGDSLFTADHVMGWSTSVVPPPPMGSAAEYLASLRRLLDRDDQRYFSGHGPVIGRPRAMVTHMIAQRLRRERQVAELIADGIVDVSELVGRLYPSVDRRLSFAARANVAGHIANLEGSGRIPPGTVTWRRDEALPAAF